MGSGQDDAGDQILGQFGMADTDDRKNKSKRKGKARSAVGDAGQRLSEYGEDQLERVQDQARANSMPSFKRGGVTKKRGFARLHKGERAFRKKGRSHGR